jgi:hypothetical protein
MSKCQINIVAVLQDVSDWQGDAKSPEMLEVL